MHACPIVLIACEAAELEALRRLVPAKAHVVTANSVAYAVERLRGRVDAVICSMDFDDSRMLELVREAHVQRPEVPVLCCRVFGSPISDLSFRAAATAAFSVGVAAFADLANRASILGADTTELAATLVRLLG